MKDYSRSSLQNNADLSALLAVPSLPPYNLAAITMWNGTLFQQACDKQNANYFLFKYDHNYLLNQSVFRLLPIKCSNNPSNIKKYYIMN